MAEATKYGRWVKRKANEHTCNKPAYDRKTSAGDIWECNECGQQWEVEGMWSDQRDNYTGLKWKKGNPPSPHHIGLTRGGH